MQGFNLLLELAGELQSFIQSSPYRPAYNGGLLDIIGGIKETLTSQVITNILKYRDENGRYVLLESFIEKFVNPEIKVQRPFVFAEKERLDVSVKDKGYAIVIENKLRNAPFQRNQLARYIAKLKADYDESNIYIIIMPQFYDTPIRTSAGRLPHDWGKPKCAMDRYECWCDFPNKGLNEEQLAWCSTGCDNILGRLHKNIVKLHNDYAEWLIDEAKALPSSQWPLKSCMMQFAYYLKGLYKTRFSNNLNMAIIEYLRKRLITEGSLKENFESLRETLQEVEQLNDGINLLQGQIAIDMVKEWEEELKKEFPNIVSNLDSNGIYSFGLLFNGLWMGCWSGGNGNDKNSPYWGFFLSKETDNQSTMVSEILEYCRLESEKPTNNFKAWGYTLDGYEVCKMLFEAALAKGYK